MISVPKRKTEKSSYTRTRALLLKPGSQLLQRFLFDRIISAKKPEYSLLCTEDYENLTAGERLRVMRLRAGYTIEQAARAIGVGRRVIMNYELSKVKRCKQRVLDELFNL